MSDRVRVGTENDFEDKDRILVDIDGMEIGVFRLEGDYYAIPNRCPHQKGPVATGDLMRPITAEVPEVGEWVEDEYDTDTCVIRCPLHGWGYNIRTGENMADPVNAPSLPTFEVEVDNGEVFLNI